MSSESDDPGLISNIKRKIASVSIAAAALLAEQSPGVAAQPLGNLLRTATFVQADERSTKRPQPAPLILRPSEGGASVSLAGHRSHSSHSSHRSHVSSSLGSHSSHFSGSMRAPRGHYSSYPSSTRDSVQSGSSSPPAAKSPVPPRYTTTKRPVSSGAETESGTPATQPKPAPVIDFDDPTERYKVLSFIGGGDPRATILDLKTEDRHLAREGGMIDEYKVIRVDIPKRIVQLRGKNFDTITLKYKKN